MTTAQTFEKQNKVVYKVDDQRIWPLAIQSIRFELHFSLSTTLSMGVSIPDRALNHFMVICEDRELDHLMVVQLDISLSRLVFLLSCQAPFGVFIFKYSWV